MINRAQTPKQKQEIIERLLALWLRYPELRLGQLILNCFRTDFYHVEDYDLIKTLDNGHGEQNEQEARP